jgi:uncharacterized protein (TIGR03083 family)
MASSHPILQVADHVKAVSLEGSRLAAAATRAGLEAPVPSCPGWTVTELLRHLSYVHDWAARHVREGLETTFERDPEAVVVASGPSGAQLVERYRESNQRLVAALQAADPGLRCWTFLPAPSPLAFWARRQAHETTIHRVDAELASGPVNPVTPEFAADGLDELLFGFCSPARMRRSQAERSLALVATDCDRRWLVQADQAGMSVTAAPDPAQYELQGPAADLYLILWNRPAGTGVTADGDSRVMDWWRQEVRITWE